MIESITHQLGILMKNEQPKGNHGTTYIGAFIAIGVGMGTALGVALDNMLLGMAIGVASGAVIGIAQEIRKGKSRSK